MNNMNQAIFTPSGCLTEEALMKYISGTLTGEEFSLAGVHLAGCEMCADAAEGLGLWLEQNQAKKTEGDLTEVQSPNQKPKGKASVLSSYRFHNRTDTINDRVKQRVEFYKKTEAVERRKISFNPYVWVSVAASIILFIGIFYAVRVQTLLDKKQLAETNNRTEALSEKADSNEITKSKTDIALNQKTNKLTFYSPVVTSEDEVYDDEMLLNQDEQKSPAIAMPEEAKPIEGKTESSGMSKAEVVEKSPSSAIIDDASPDGSVSVFTVVEEMPQFPGGEEKRQRYLSKNIKYPALASENGIQGTVYVSFIVKKDGQITNAKILRGIGGGCDEEALRVIKQMPLWESGKQNGKKVDVLFNMAVLFKLGN